MAEYKLTHLNIAWRFVNKDISIKTWFDNIVGSNFLEKELNMSINELQFREETPYHYHKKMSEIFRFHNKGKIVLDDIEFPFWEKSVLYLPPNVKHRIIPCYGEVEATLINVPKFDSSDEYIVK